MVDALREVCTCRVCWYYVVSSVQNVPATIVTPALGRVLAGDSVSILLTGVLAPAPGRVADIRALYRDVDSEHNEDFSLTLDCILTVLLVHSRDVHCYQVSCSFREQCRNRENQSSQIIDCRTADASSQVY